MSTKTRDSNIELLRILTICGVVVLHYNGNVAFSLVNPGSGNQYLLVLLEGLFVCAVNLFILISGYFLSTTTKRRFIKVIELVFQVMLISVGMTVLSCLIAKRPIVFSELFYSAIPNNYFVTLYVTLYLVSPYINLALGKLNKKQYGILLGLCVLLFAAWPTVLDIVVTITGKGYGGLYTTNSSGSQYGYSIINFALMYLIGSYLRRFGDAKKPNIAVLFVTLFSCTGILFFWQFWMAHTARAYCNPIVIAIAVVWFLLFKRLSFSSKIVNCLAKGAFTCFLMHGYFLTKIGIDRVVNGNTFILLAHILVSVSLIFLVSWVVWKVYDLVTKPLYSWLARKLTFIDRLISVEEQVEVRQDNIESFNDRELVQS